MINRSLSSVKGAVFGLNDSKIRQRQFFKLQSHSINPARLDEILNCARLIITNRVIIFEYQPIPLIVAKSWPRKIFNAIASTSIGISAFLGAMFIHYDSINMSITENMTLGKTIDNIQNILRGQASIETYFGGGLVTGIIIGIIGFVGTLWLLSNLFYSSRRDLIREVNQKIFQFFNQIKRMEDRIDSTKIISPLGLEIDKYTVTSIDIIHSKFPDTPQDPGKVIFNRKKIA